MPEEKKQELENAKRVVKKKHEGETEDGYLHVSSVDDSVVRRGGVIGSRILQIHMEKKKSESVRAVVEGRVTRAITKALEKLAWQVTEKHVSDNARELFGKPLKGKKEIEKCTREMSSKGKVRSAGRARLISLRAEKQRWKWFWLQEQWGLQGDTIMEYLMWIFLEMATGQEHVTATHFYYFLTR